MMYGNILEMFSSIQGEGLLVGCRQVFVRLAGCNLRCRYCDTPGSQTDQHSCRIETEPGSRYFKTLAGPLSAVAAAGYITSLSAVRPHSVSFTGGEPLLQAAFLKELLQRVQTLPVGKYLETNGTLTDNLADVISLLDIVGMDIKLPSVSQMTCWEEHRNFLRVARQKSLFVKVVVSAATVVEECIMAAELIREVDQSIPLILQPVTPSNQQEESPGPAWMLKLQALLLKYLTDVRVIPQTHKFMGQL